MSIYTETPKIILFKCHKFNCGIKLPIVKTKDGKKYLCIFNNDGKNVPKLI